MATNTRQLHAPSICRKIRRALSKFRPPSSVADIATCTCTHAPANRLCSPAPVPDTVPAPPAPATSPPSIHPTATPFSGRDAGAGGRSIGGSPVSASLTITSVKRAQAVSVLASASVAAARLPCMQAQTFTDAHGYQIPCATSVYKQAGRQAGRQACQANAGSPPAPPPARDTRQEHVHFVRTRIDIKE